MYIIKSKIRANKTVIFSLIFLLFMGQVFAQKKVIDQVIAVVGNRIVLKSELQNQYNQYVQQGYDVNNKTRCVILENLLYQKLLLNQTAIDSVKVSDDQVNTELDRRIRYFVQQIGSEQKLESFYHKSIAQIKDEFRELIKNQLLVQTMQSKITADVNVTPDEVKNYYNNIPKDSLPKINSKVKVAQIVIYPEITKAEKQVALDKIKKLRKRIENGEDFSTMAILYSEDPGSASKGGELGFVSRGELEPKFAAAAFKLKANEISPVVETKYGYHIIQLIARRGEKINVRHILIIPETNAKDLLKTETKLDSLRKFIKTDSITFDQAATKYSDDETTKNNGGLLTDAQSGSPEIDMKNLDPKVFFTIDKLEPGKISKAVPYKNPEGKQGYRLLKLISRSKPHKATLKQDYAFIEQAATQVKKNEIINKWIKDHIKTTYVHIDSSFDKCQFTNPWPKAEK